MKSVLPSEKDASIAGKEMASMDTAKHAEVADHVNKTLLKEVNKNVKASVLSVSMHVNVPNSVTQQ